MNSITEAYLDAVAGGRLPADELAKTLAGADLTGTLYAGGYLPRPIFLDRAEHERLSADLRVLHDALTALPDRLFDGDAAAFAAAVGAQGPQIDAARTAHGQVTRLSRADLYAGDEGFKVLELNVTGALGGLENARLNEAFLDDPHFARFAAEHRLGHVDTMVALAETLREETTAAGTDPLVGIVDWPDSFPNLEGMLRRNARQLGELGIEAVVGHAGQLEYRDGGVWLHGRRLGVVYRLFLIESLLRPGGAELLAPVLAAAARGEVAMFTPIASELFGSKAALALLSDERNRDRFSAAELDVVDRLLPWTRPVRPDLLAYAREHREQLVIKATMLHAGHGFVAGWRVGADEWERELARAEGGPFVLQRRVVPRPEPMPEPHVTTWGVFLTGQGYAGAYSRAVPGVDAGAVSYSGGATPGCVFHQR